MAGSAACLGRANSCVFVYRVRPAAGTEMDLLGARPVLAEALSLPRWSETSPEPPQPLDLESLPNAHIINPFPVRDDLNRKIALW